MVFIAPHADVIPERNRAHEPGAVDVHVLAHRQRRGDYGAAGVGAARTVVVVGLVRLGAGAVDHGGLDWAAQQVGRDDSGHAAAAHRAGELQRMAAGGQA